MRIRPIVPAAVMLLLSASLAAPAAPPAASTPAVAVHERADLRDAVAKQVDAHLKEWLDLYRTIHAAPELSLSEVKSAQRMADLFRRAGFAVTPELGGHGVVGMLANGDGPVILIRGDMDALPVIEETGLPYASTVKIEQGDGSHVGVMHACGHDVHQTVLAATGQVLASLKDRWRGTVLLVAQPAEEIGRGARMMIDDGLFTKFPKPTACIALHVAADMETGIVATTPGWYAANVDSIDIRIYGKGGHGAYPHWARDPIVAAAQVIVSLQTIISRRNDPIESAVVTVGSIHGGSKHNIIPSEVDLQLTVRTYRDDVRKMVLDEIRSITVHTCQAMGLPREPDVHVRDQEFTPAGYNDPR
ncbi:MAG: amidohydrolase [Phycisphaerae bacterium]